MFLTYIKTERNFEKKQMVTSFEFGRDENYSRDSRLAGELKDLIMHYM